jgi:hypothetical protein
MALEVIVQLIWKYSSKRRHPLWKRTSREAGDIDEISVGDTGGGEAKKLVP